MRPLLLLLLVALLALVGRTVWWPQDSQAQRGASKAFGVGDADTGATQDLASTQGPNIPAADLERSKADRLEGEEASRFGVAGQVHWQHGGPVADQVVILVEEETGTTLAETRTDAQGRYALFLPQGEHTQRPPRDSYDLYCPGFVLANPHEAFATPNDPPPTTDLLLLPGRKVRILSRLHRDGTPAADVHVRALCDLDYEHELFIFTDADGMGALHLPHEGPWAFTAHTRQLEGYDIGFPITPWIDADVVEVVVEVIAAPVEVHLQAVDATTGAAVEHATYRAAQAPEDARYLPPVGLALLPTPLPQEGGSLHAVFERPGRAFLKVEAEGYLPEVVEWVEDDPRMHEVPLIPLLPNAIEVTRHGRPVSTAVSIGFNRRSLLLHPEEVVHALAASPQVGTLHPFQSNAQGHCDLLLPDPAADGAPVFFDLWIQNGSERRFFGSLAPSNLGPAPWVFELAPPTGTLILNVVDADGNGVPAVPFQIKAIRDLPSDRANGSSRARSQIQTSNLDGRIEVQLWAPSKVEVVGSGTMRAARVDAEGYLEEGATLNLQVVIDPQERAMQPYPITRGRILVDGGEDYARDQRLLSVRATPLDQRAIQAQLQTWQVRSEADREGNFRFHLPEGLYAFTLDAEDYDTAREAGRFATCEAGAEDLELHIPPPAGLRIHTTDLSNGQPLRPDDVVLKVGGRLLTAMETWEGGDAANLSLFAGRVTFVVECEGYAPKIGSVDLAPGRTTELFLGLDRGRAIRFRTVDGDGEFRHRPDLRILWMNPPGGDAPYEVFLLEDSWPAAPLTAIRLGAFLGDTPIGTFDLPAGMAEEELPIPLPASAGGEDQ